MGESRARRDACDNDEEEEDEIVPSRRKIAIECDLNFRLKCGGANFSLGGWADFDSRLIRLIG